MEAKIITDSKLWDDFVENSPTGHIVQSWQWGKFRKNHGYPITRLGVMNGSKLIAAATYTLHKIPFTSYNVGYLPKGPVVTDPDPKIMAAFLEALKEYARTQKCVFIRLEPNFLTTSKFKLPLLTEIVSAPKNILPAHTLTLDLTQDSDTLLKNMHEKWRYNIRLAEKKGVNVTETDDIETFIRLQRETAARDKFYTHSDSYYRDLWKILHPLGFTYLLQAKHEENNLACWMLFKFGQTLYYPYGASSSIKRNLMASHAIMWGAIKLGQKHHLQTFDLWGASPEEADTNDPWLGFTTFKLGFGAHRVSFVGTYDLVINPAWYKLFNLTDNLRWKILRTFR